MKSGLFDTVVVTSRRDLRNFGRDEERNGPAPGESKILDEPARQEIEHMANVLEAYTRHSLHYGTALRRQASFDNGVSAAVFSESPTMRLRCKAHFSHRKPHRK